MMTTDEKIELVAALTVTAEVLGHEIKPNTLVVMADDLAEMQLDAVLAALTRCRRELTGRLTLAAILERLQASDGRLTANEAWAIAVRSMDEADTVILNDEISEALGFARDIFNSGDEIGARMAFRDSYERITKQAREQGKPVKWWPSLGHDVARRESAVQQAVVSGLLPASRLDALPSPGYAGVTALLENASEGVPPEVASVRIKAVRDLFAPPKPTHVPLTKEQVEERKAEIFKQAQKALGEKP